MQYLNVENDGKQIRIEKFFFSKNENIGIFA